MNAFTFLVESHYGPPQAGAPLSMPMPERLSR